MKKELKVLGIIFAICLLLSGCFKKPSENNTNNNDDNIKRNIEIKKIANYDNIINNVEFTNEVAGTRYDKFSAVFSDTDKVTYKFDDSNGNVEVSKEVTIGSIVKGLTLAAVNDEGVIYVLTQNGEVYFVQAYRTGEAVVKKMDINGASSFAALYTDLEGNGDYQMIILIKTDDGRVYTDYKFSDETTRFLKEIVGEN